MQKEIKELEKIIPNYDKIKAKVKEQAIKLEAENKKNSNDKQHN